MTDQVESTVMPPATPPEWWPGQWPWPPTTYQPADVSQKEAWVGKIDRVFEHTSDRDQERFWEQRRQDANLADERHDVERAVGERSDRRELRGVDRQGERDAEAQRARDAARAERDRLYDRQAKREEDRRQVDDELRRHYLEMQTLLLTRLIAQADDKHAMVMNIFAGMSRDSNLAASMNYDRATEKAMNTQLLQAVRDSVATALKEIMGTVPARAGVAAPTTPFQPTPTS